MGRNSIRHKPNEYPRVWLVSGRSVGVAGAETREVPEKAADATIALRRRPGAQEYKDPLWLKQRGTSLTVAPLELEVAQPLPDVCTAHGRPSVSRLATRTSFFETTAHPRHPRAGLQMFRRSVSTIVAGEWPVCDRCVRKRQWFHGIAGILMIMMALNVVGLIIVARVLEYQPLVVPMAFGVLPGSLPIGAVVAFVLFDKGDNRTTPRPIDDERFLRVDAHPNFGAALRHVR